MGVTVLMSITVTIPTPEVLIGSPSYLERGTNRPFYSCMPSDLAFEGKRGWR